tara:strand:+ start:123 stop:452 length:330 start_codon:yes stop_codon:yes gene_type:complete
LAKRLYVIELQNAKVYGAHASDHDGCDLVFAFVTREDASAYVEDLLRYWPDEVMVPSFSSKTFAELKQDTEDKDIYPYPSPVIEVMYMADGTFLPTVVEKKDVAHSKKR